MRELKLDGCTEPDILKLLQQFAQHEKAIGEAFWNAGEVEAAGADARKDIGEFATGAAGSIRQLKVKELAKFMTKVEDIVDTELGTLLSHIQKNTSSRKQYLSLDQFKEHVHNWAVAVWRDRMPAE